MSVFFVASMLRLEALSGPAPGPDRIKLSTWAEFHRDGVLQEGPSRGEALQGRSFTWVSSIGLGFYMDEVSHGRSSTVPKFTRDGHRQDSAVT